MNISLILRRSVKGFQGWPRWGGQVLISVWAMLLFWPMAAFAQRLDPALRASFLANPLQDEPRDPLLPSPEIERPLSPLEVLTLEQGLVRLDQEATILIKAGDGDAAFERWMREVRLQRILGLDAEIGAIDRVGQQAWVAQRSVEIQLLSARLREIVAVSLTDEVRLEQLVEISLTLRDRQSSIALYQQLVQLAAQRNDGLAQRQQLEKLAEFHLAWFEYVEAAPIYEQLLADARSRGDLNQRILYLQQLIYSYQSAKNYGSALTAQTELLTLYRTTGRFDREAALEVAIARNYRALNQLATAITYYRTAYSTAQRLQQYGYSSNVLQDLGALYTASNQYADAIRMYNLLVDVEQQSYNHYGIMYAYDQLGQIYRSQQDNTNARIAFKAGLAFAEALDYRQDYFKTQLATLDE